MRHRLKGRKLGRTTSHRQAMARNLVTSLFVYGRVVTTVTRAKEFRGLAERMITLAKRAAGKDAPTRLAHLRRILRTVQDRHVAAKILDDVARRFTDRAGGYTRILKLGGSRWDGDGRGQYAFNRLGDNGPKAIWELVVRKDREEEMKLAGRGRAAHEAEEAKKAEKKSKKGAAATT
ncbi:MAG: 50S ribosomal protein L17 [Planctomycetes bacterium]|nr:50S ribosomal protein L17 [Planctomycetota bacterium]